MNVTYITPRCMMCGKFSVLTLDPMKIERWRKGEHVQSVWPEMPAGEREMLISGTHPDCWDAMFSGMDEEDEEDDEEGCPDCGMPGVTAGHMECQYPQDRE